MPFPYAYYQDNYNGPIHATRFKANAYVSLPSTAITASGDIDATEHSVLRFDTSGSNLVIDSLTGIQDGQIIEIIKTTSANSLTIKNISGVGTGSKFYNATNSDIVFPTGRYGGAFFVALQEGAVLKLFEIESSQILDKNSVGLGNVDNTSDAQKFSSPVLTGTPTAPTAPFGTDSTQLATTAFVQTAMKTPPAPLSIPVLDINWNLADIYYKSISTNSTFTFSNVTDGKTISAIIINTSGAAITLTLPAGIKVKTGFSLSVPAGQANVYTFMRANSITYASCVDGLV